MSDKTTNLDNPELRRRLGIMTPDELAAALNTSVSAINSWRRPPSRSNPLGGQGPAWTRLGRRIYYRDEDVRAWVDTNVGKPWAGSSDGDE